MKKEIKKSLPNNLKKSKTKNIAKRLLLCLFLFWTIGAIVAFSCLVLLVSDKHSGNTSMITAKADSGLYNSIDLTGLDSSFVNDGYVNIYSDNLTLAMSAPVGGFSLVSSNETVPYMYEDINTWKPILVDFYDATSSVYSTFVVEFKILSNSYTLLDSTYRLVDILYTQYDMNKTISCAFRYYNGSSTVFVTLHLRAEENYPFILFKSGTVDVGFDEQYVNNLRGQINDLNYQISQLNDIIAGLRADILNMEQMSDYEIEQLNATILSMSSTIAEKNSLIDELNAEIRTLIAGKNAVYQTGYDTGFADGATAGAADAYNQGYAAAVADGQGGGNFRSMIGALIDVPVNAVTSLLDWNLLGINLKEFFFSILSVIVVVKIAMLFMR